MLPNFFRVRALGIIGNVLEHYDNAIFGLLAPFIAPLFFAKEDPITALILTYSMLVSGMAMRPLGSLFFGWMGDYFGRSYALFGAFIGMAISTFAMGCLPVYNQIGILAPILLALGKMIQNFCAGGSTAGAAIFVLEHTKLEKRSFMSSIYDASSILGALIASAIVFIFSEQEFIEQGWRYLFWFGGFTAIFAIFLRLKSLEVNEFIDLIKAPKMKLLSLIKQEWGPLLSIILVSGFSYMTYSISFILMNGFVPLVSSISKPELMKVNTILLLVDMLMLPFFGYLGSKFGKEKLMIAAALSSAICMAPLFYLLNEASMMIVILVRFIIVMFAVAFASTYHAWAIERVKVEHRYTILSLGSAIGSQVVGAPTAAISLWLYKTIGSTMSPSIYFITVSLLVSFIVYRVSKSEKALA
ncbi:MAG: MFS transporter [Chlamydiae bacterium]|nr:MFS transporter [Chlamydiota bacterium]